MRKLILCVGAAAFALGTPALARPGHGHEKDGKARSAESHWNDYSSHRGRHEETNRHGDRGYAFNERGACPPGLAKKRNGCLPPGQARKMYNVGQRYNRHFGNAWRYNQIPYNLRSRYRLNRNDRYYYRNGYLYQVNPRTMLVQQIISALNH